jgi:hypothetical protein
MRTTSLKTVYLTMPELKEAVARYIRDKRGEAGTADLYEHLMNNVCEMAWTQDGKEFLVSMDGEIEDNIISRSENE